MCRIKKNNNCLEVLSKINNKPISMQVCEFENLVNNITIEC